MRTHIHINVHAHLYTERKSQQQHLNASNNIIDAHTHSYTHACMYTFICISKYVHNLQWMCHRCVCWCQRNFCITHTVAHALVPRPPVLKCTQHSLQKNAHIHIHTHMCMSIHMHMTIHAHLRHCSNTLKNGYWDTKSMHKHAYTYIYTFIYLHGYTCTYTHADMYIYMHVHTHTYIHTYMHTHTTCTYAHTQARLERHCCSDCARSWCRCRKLHTSLSFIAINHM